MTKDEAAYQRDVRGIGCIACIVSLGFSSPCDIHHLLSGGRKIGEMFVLGLCPPHHRSGLNNDTVVSRHHWKAEFERRYGTEAQLLARTRALVADRRRMAA